MAQISCAEASRQDSSAVVRCMRLDSVDPERPVARHSSRVLKKPGRASPRSVVESWSWKEPMTPGLCTLNSRPPTLVRLRYRSYRPGARVRGGIVAVTRCLPCLLYTSDAAD